MQTFEEKNSVIQMPLKLQSVD